MGWKTVERIVETRLSFDEAVATLVEAGFQPYASSPMHALLKNPVGERIPVELAIAAEDAALWLQLRYDGFILFDTGDLAALADDVSELVAPPSRESVEARSPRQVSGTARRD